MILQASYASAENGWHHVRCFSLHPSSITNVRSFAATSRRRQNANPDQDFGSAFDGSQGVDSQDILNIPDISFGTFQLFPDQNSYGIDDPTLPAFNNTVNQGLAWIKQHAMAGMMYVLRFCSSLGGFLSIFSRLYGRVNKPVTLNGFGLVSQSNAAFFVPFNSTESPVISIFGNSTTGLNLTSFFTDEQRNEAYATWLRAGLEVGLQGMFQYQVWLECVLFYKLADNNPSLYSGHKETSQPCRVLR